MSEESDSAATSRLSPQVELASLPRHYVSSDMPHVLAHVRFMDEFCSAVDELDDTADGKYEQILKLYAEMASRVLAPYVLDLARSLISLEDACQPAGENS